MEAGRALPSHGVWGTQQCEAGGECAAPGDPKCGPRTMGGIGGHPGGPCPLWPRWGPVRSMEGCTCRASGWRKGRHGQDLENEGQPG